MADSKFILGFALILLVAYASNAATTPAPTTPAGGSAKDNTTVTVSSQVTFDYKYNVSSTNLTEGSEDYDKVKAEFEAAFLQMFKEKGVEGISGVKVTGMRKGSLILDIEIEVDKEQNPNYETKVKDAMNSMANGNLTVGGEPVPVLDLSLKDLDLTMKVTSTKLEVGLDKNFGIECHYNKTNQTDVIAINSIKLLHKAPGKAKYDDIASLYDNSVFENRPFNPYKVNVIKNLGFEESGLLTLNSREETFIKLEWIYPKVDIVGEFKCVVHWSDRKSNAGVYERSMTIEEKDPVLKTVIQNVVTIDKSLDALKEDVDHLDSRRLHLQNKIMKSDANFAGSTYLLAKNLWGNTVSAQTLCQVNGAYLVEIDTAAEWAAIKTLIKDEPGPVLAGATNKRTLHSWEFMRGTMKPEYFDWASSADLDSTDKRCMAFQKSGTPPTFKMANVRCSAMMYETFMCEMPEHQRPGEPISVERVELEKIRPSFVITRTAK